MPGFLGVSTQMIEFAPLQVAMWMFGLGEMHTLFGGLGG